MLTIQLLGGFKLTHDGEPIPGLTRPRGKALLAYLLLHHATPQDRAHLAYTFWPETSDKQARTNLRRELHQLRRLSPLFVALIQSDGQSVQWQMPADSTLDVIQFTHLFAAATQATDHATSKAHYQAAIDCYHGDLLPGLYDEWVLAKREELRQAYIRSLESLTARLSTDRDYTTATTLTQRLLQYDPLYEAGYVQLMQLYALQDDRARALHTYHSCVTVLERELGVPPSEEVEQLYQRLLHAETQSREPRQVASTTLQLVGRKDEWQTVLNAWRRVAQGRAHCVLIEGEAGIGKTRLAEELLEWVTRQGILSARTRSYAAEGALAYAPVVEWLRSPALRRAIAVLDPVWRTELARLLPELLTQFPALPRPEPLTERWQRQRLFEALARVVTIDEGPKLLLIDDLQWCDQETLEWLRFLLRFAPDAPLLVMGTVRIEEVDDNHPLHALIRELRGAEQLTIIELNALSVTETSELVGQVTRESIDEAKVARLFMASAGNPLFVVEMVRAGFWEETPTGKQSSISNTLPPKVYAVIEHRLAQLSPVVRALADLAAVIGRGFSYSELLAANSGEEEMIVNGLDELWQRKIIREHGANFYDFSHDRIREATYAALSPMRRKLLHQRIVQMLETVYHTATDPVSGELAFHCEQAGLIEEAIQWYQRAAQVAVERHAFHDAANYQRSAIKQLSALPSSPENQQQEMMLQFEYAYSMAAIIGMSAIARRTALQRAKELAETLHNVNSLARSLYELWSAYQAVGEANQIRICVDEAYTIIDQLTDAQEKFAVYKMLAGASKHFGEFTKSMHIYANALQSGAAALESTNPSSSTGFIPVNFDFAIILWLIGFPQRAWETIRAYRVQRDRLLAPFNRTNMMFQASILLRNLGYDTVLAEEATQMSMLGAQYEMAMSQQSGAVFTGWLLAKRGDLTKGIELTQQGIDGFRRTGHTMYQTHRLAMLVEMLLWAGRLQEAETVLQEAIEVSERAEERFWDVELYRLRGDLLLAQGEPDEQAEAAYWRAIEIAQQQGAKSLELRATIALCRLWQRQGRTNEAYQSLAKLYGWFTEGFDTHDLRVAQSLLTELAT